MDRNLIPTSAARSRRVLALDGWNEAGAAITRALRFPDFRRAVEFVRAIAPHAEELDHHPEVTLIAGELFLRLTTHDAGGLTEYDFALAERIDEVARAADYRSAR